ncbi:Vacuolar protein 8, partial [Marasmius sp. AFHP31]
MVQLLEMGVCEVLIPLTNSPSSEVQGNSAAALGNLPSKDGRSATDDYPAFNDVWEKPDAPMLLSSTLLYGQSFNFLNQESLNIRTSTLLVPNIRNLAGSQASSPSPSVGSRSQSFDDTETNNGQAEIQLLARRIVEFVDGDRDSMVPSSVTPSHIQPGSSISSSLDARGHEELRRSVREAFAP